MREESTVPVLFQATILLRLGGETRKNPLWNKGTHVSCCRSYGKKHGGRSGS